MSVTLYNFFIDFSSSVGWILNVLLNKLLQHVCMMERYSRNGNKIVKKEAEIILSLLLLCYLNLDKMTKHLTSLVLFIYL